MAVIIQDIHTDKGSYIFGVDKEMRLSFSIYENEVQKDISKIIIIYGIEILHDQKVIAIKKDELILQDIPNTLAIGALYNFSTMIPIIYPNHEGEFIIRNYIRIVCDINGTLNDTRSEYFPNISTRELHIQQNNSEPDTQILCDIGNLPDVRIIHDSEKFQNIQNQIDAILGKNDITEVEELTLKNLYEEQKKYYTIDIEQQKKNENDIKKHFEQLTMESEALLERSRLLLKSTSFPLNIFSYEVGLMLGIIISLSGLLLVDKNLYLANIFLCSGVFLFIVVYFQRKINQRLKVKFHSKSSIKKSLLKGPILPHDIFCSISKSWRFRNSSYEYNFTIVLKNVVYIIENEGKRVRHRNMIINTIEIGRFQGKDPSLDNIVWNQNLEILPANIFPIGSLKRKLYFAFFSSTYTLSTGYIIQIEHIQDSTQQNISLEFKPAIFS